MPKVFISYSWDSKEHRSRVKQFVVQLRENGIEVEYDDEVHTVVRDVLQR
jgi:hypothetical protein